jgi:radical SAM superfamily enzyme YgiQ (UPF0313 family)
VRLAPLTRPQLRTSNDVMPLLETRRDLTGVRLLLVHPGIYDDVRARGFPPWGILYVASACRVRGAEVHIADLNGEDVASRMREMVTAFDPSVIGVTGKLGKGAERMRQVVEASIASTDAPIAVGGPLVSSFPERDHALWSGIHSLFMGDGEVEFPDWIAAGCPRTVGVGPGRAADLDVLGLPTWWDGLGEYVYDGEHWPGMNVRSVHVSAARGCTRRCTFCYLNTQYPGHSFRVLAPGRLLEGCGALHERWGVEGFYFVDDCLLNPGHPDTEALLSMLIQRGSPYRFGCDLQIQELEDTHLIGRMYEAGFRALYVGIEAASPAVRRRLGKGRCGSSIYDIISHALDMGFVVRSSVGLGWPGETEGEMRETISLVRSLPGLAIDAFRYTPLNGAPLTKFWARGRTDVLNNGEWNNPFSDYSEYSLDCSGLNNDLIEGLWAELLDIEGERHGKYFKND